MKSCTETCHSRKQIVPNYETFQLADRTSLTNSCQRYLARSSKTHCGFEINIDYDYRTNTWIGRF